MGKLLNKRGFTMVSVGVIVVVTILLISTVVISAVSSISNAKKINFSADIVYIQDEVDNYYIKSGYTAYPTGNSVVVDTTLIASVELYQFNGEDIDPVTSEIILNEINFDIIGIKQRVYGNNESELDKYVVSTTTGKVYYIAGVKATGRTYYTVVPDLNKEYKRKLNLTSNSIVIDDVILELSEIEYTNSPVTVKVRLPEEYSYAGSPPVTASDGKSVSSENTVGGYKEINVNYTGSSRNGNYSIIINYTKNGVGKKVTYMVENFDSTAPEIPSDPAYSVISSKDPSDGKFSAYITFIEPTDNLSGVRMVKYAEENVLQADAKIYFENYGKKVLNNKIKINNYPIYTIYIEDNAGNCKVYNVPIPTNILEELE